MNNIQIEQIDNLNNILNIDSDSKLEINFKSDSIEIFNNFVKQNEKQKYIYQIPKSKLNINLFEYNLDIYTFFIYCVESANKKINLSLYKNLIQPNNIWNICICSDIMFNLPFTLNQYIYIPINFISNCYDLSDSTKLIKTLIHEKIHVGQRFLEDSWEKFIDSFSTNWIKVSKDKNSSIYDSVIKIKQNNSYEFVTNPDTWYDFTYVYKNIDRLYYGQFIYDKRINNIKIIFFDITDNTDIKLVDNILDEEHPYELTAYKLSDLIA